MYKTFKSECTIEIKQFISNTEHFNLKTSEHVEIIPNSVESVNVSSDYSALENESLSDTSLEIPFQSPIFIKRTDLFNSYKDELTKTINEECDMSIDPITFEPLILEKVDCNENGRKSSDSTFDTSDMSLEITNINSVIIEHHPIENNITNILSTQDNSCSTPLKVQENLTAISPDLFSGDLPEKSNYLLLSNLNSSQLISPSTICYKEKYTDKSDRELLKNIQSGLSGVLPPRSLTVTNISACEMLSKLKTNEKYFWWNDELKNEDNNKIDSSKKSLLINTRSEEEVLNSQWPDILYHRYHGLHYNRGKISEEIAKSCDKYQKRFIGAETQSSCTLQETPKSVKKTTMLKWSTKSPGKRLSHLARRKITFNSGISHTSGALVGSRARQILVDARNMASLRRSPKKSPRKTPNKSPRLKPRTPSSSAKKKLAMKFRKITGENTRRALFPSPRKPSPMKRKKSPFKHGGIFYPEQRKRKHSETWDESLHAAKLARSMSVDTFSNNINNSSMNKSLIRTQSESVVPLNKLSSTQELTDVQKKKLQWAVYDALQSTNTTRNHPQWKLFAAVLGKVVKYFYLNHQSATNVTVGECGTTERMSRIARIHVFSVIKGKSADEIVTEYLKSKQKLFKPQGYIAPEDYLKIASVNKENIFCQTDSSKEEKSKIRKSPYENRVDSIKKVINF